MNGGGPNMHISHLWEPQNTLSKECIFSFFYFIYRDYYFYLSRFHLWGFSFQDDNHVCYHDVKEHTEVEPRDEDGERPTGVVELCKQVGNADAVGAVVPEVEATCRNPILNGEGGNN